MPIVPLLLKMRRADQGGDIDPYPDTTQFQANWTHARLVVLIHGYNNIVSEATTAYDGFFSMQSELGNNAPGGNFAPDRDFVEVFWPGDSWGPLRPMYYPLAVGQAEGTAAALSNLLKNLSILRPGGLDLEIVAHSLGCRLALALMRDLTRDPHIRILRAVFMAAAVPLFMLEDEVEHHGLRLGYDQEIIDAALSLYSGNDAVLAEAFPIGQTTAPGDEGFFPVALGHAKWESAARPPQLSQLENRGAGHSDYWGWVEATRDTCGRFANTNIREFLGFTGSGDRATPEISVSSRVLQEGSVMATRDTPARETPSRVQ